VVDEITYFLTEILPHCPKTLKSLVVSSAEMPEFRSEVNAFVTKEKALELTKLMFYMPAIRGWFNDTKNVVYWFKYPSFEKYRLKYPDNNRPFVKYTEGDFTSAQFDLPSVTETDIKELFVLVRKMVAVVIMRMSSSENTYTDSKLSASFTMCSNML